jgi:hypothetical protein
MLKGEKFCKTFSLMVNGLLPQEGVGEVVGMHGLPQLPIGRPVMLKRVKRGRSAGFGSN